MFGATFTEATVLAIVLCTATVSCVFALFALFFSVRSDLRKTGIGIRCDFVSMAPRNWATVAEESCTTYLTTDVGKSGKVATIWEREETDLTLRPIFRQSRP